MEHQVSNFTEYRDDRLKPARMAIELSCEELAEGISKAKQFVNELEKGYRSSEQCLGLVSSALMIEPSSLFTERKYAPESDVCHLRGEKFRT